MYAKKEKKNVLHIKIFFFIFLILFILYYYTIGPLLKIF